MGTAGSDRWGCSVDLALAQQTTGDAARTMAAAVLGARPTVIAVGPGCRPGNPRLAALMDAIARFAAPGEAASVPAARSGEPAQRRSPALRLPTPQR